MTARLKKIFANATFAALLAATLAGCASAPPPARQVSEYQRHLALGLEKHAAGQLGAARSAFQRAVGPAELDDDAALIATALLNLGACELLLDNADAAGSVYARAVREARLAGHRGLEWQAVSGLAEATRRLGQPAKALELFAARPADVRPDEAIRLPAELSRARALADSGDTAAGMAVVATVEAAASQRPPPDPALAAALYTRALLLLASQQTDAALAPATAALALDRQRHHPPSVGDDHALLGQLALRRQDAEAARHHLQRAAAIYLQTGQERRAATAQQALQTLIEPR